MSKNILKRISSVVLVLFLAFTLIILGRNTLPSFAQESNPTPSEEISPTPSVDDTLTPTEEPSPSPTDTPNPTDVPTPPATPTPTVTTSSEEGQITAVLYTDKADYSPTQIAIIFGSGFKPNTTYTLEITSDNLDVKVEVTADSSGNFAYSYQLDGTYRPLYNVVAKDSSENIVATTSFTDAPPPSGPAGTDFAQCSNKNPTLGNCVWIGSIVQASNSQYFEGMTVPQRLLFRDTQIANGTHHITFTYQYTKAGIHAYDFLTTVNPKTPTVQGNAPPETLNPCANLGSADTTACNSLDPSVSSPIAEITVPGDPFNSKDSAPGVGTGSTQAVKETNYETANGGAGSRKITVYAPSGSAFSSPSITLMHSPATADSDTGDTDVTVDITFTSSGCSTGNGCNYLLYFGGHLALTGVNNNTGSNWGPGLGSSQISGGPYHIKSVKFDGSGGSLDNQIKGADILVPVETPTVTTELHNNTTEAVISTGSSVPLGINVHDKATVGQTTNGIPTGSAIFRFYNSLSDCTNDSAFSGGTLKGTVVLVSGVAHPSTATGVLGPGTYAFKAKYISNDTSKWNDATGSCEDFTVDQGTSSVTTALHQGTSSGETTPTIVAVGGSVPLGTIMHDLATVTVSGATAPTGSVDFRFYNSLVSCTDDSTFSGGTTAGSHLLDGANPGVTHPSSDTAALAPGTYAFKAKWAGDTNYTGNTSSCESFTVDKSQLSLESKVHDASHVDKTNNSVPLGSIMHDTAKLSGGVIGGFTPPAITFKSYTNGTCSAGETSVGNAGADQDDTTRDRSATSAALGAGSYSYKAFVAGDSNYIGTDSGCEPFTVDQGTLTLSTTVHTDNPDEALVGNASLGTSLHDSASVSGINASFAPANSVTFKFYDNNNCSEAGTSAGSHAISGGVTHPSDSKGPLAAGPHAFRAFYDGSTDANYGPDSLQSDCEPFIVNKADLSISTELHKANEDIISIGGSVSLGTTMHDKATVSGIVGSFAPVNNVDFTFYNNNNCGNSGASAGSVAFDGSGVAHPSSSEGPLTAHDYSFKASIAGDDNYNGDTSSCEDFTVNQGTSTVATELHQGISSGETTPTIVAVGGSVLLGTIMHDLATVAQSGPFAPTGSADFTFYNTNDCSDNGASAGTVALSGGVAHPSSDTAALAAGSYGFKASWLGDDNYTGNISSCEHFTVQKATPTVVTEVHNSSEGVVTSETLDSIVHDKATVTGIGGFGPTGNVDFSFYANGTCSPTGTGAGTVALDVNGVAHPSDPKILPGAGSYSFRAHYVGDDNYKDADSDCEPFTYTTLTINKLVNGVGTFGYAVAGPTNATPSITTTNGTSGSATVPVLAGPYTVGENDPTPFIFVSLSCAGVSPSSPANRTSPSFNALAGQNTICNFENTKRTATRTQGFWATHTVFTDTSWASVSSTQKNMSNWGAGCTGIIDADAVTGHNELMGGFWANIAKTSGGTNRSNLDKARMALLQQVLAALLNRYALGTPDGGLIATAETAYCGTDLNAIRNSTGTLDTYNSSGDTASIGTVPNASPSVSKNQANIPFWNTPKNPTPDL